MRSGWLVMILSVASPIRVSFVTALAVNRQLVTVSGKVTRTTASPFASVTTTGSQRAVSGKSLRGFARYNSSPPPPPPSPHKERQGARLSKERTLSLLGL